MKGERERCGGDGWLEYPCKCYDKKHPGHTEGRPCPGCPDCRRCRACAGRGLVDREISPTASESRYVDVGCPRCHGTGVEPDPAPEPPSEHQWMHERGPTVCERCGYQTGPNGPTGEDEAAPCEPPSENPEPVQAWRLDDDGGGDGGLTLFPVPDRVGSPDPPGEDDLVVRKSDYDQLQAERDEAWEDYHRQKSLRKTLAHRAEAAEAQVKQLRKDNEGMRRLLYGGEGATEHDNVVGQLEQLREALEHIAGVTPTTSDKANRQGIREIASMAQRALNPPSDTPSEG